MIILITHREMNEKTRRMETLVSHGVNHRTLKTVILPTETPEALGAQFSQEFGWHFPDDDSPSK